jgi:hypothetical protein
MEQNRTEQNRTEQNRTEQNRTEQNRTEQNRTEQKLSLSKSSVVCSVFIITSRTLRTPQVRLSYLSKVQATLMLAQGTTKTSSRS